MNHYGSKFLSTITIGSKTVFFTKGNKKGLLSNTFQSNSIFYRNFLFGKGVSGKEEKIVLVPTTFSRYL